jgi:hypothetical protein
MGKYSKFRYMFVTWNTILIETEDQIMPNNKHKKITCFDSCIKVGITKVNGDLPNNCRCMVF